MWYRRQIALTEDVDCRIRRILPRRKSPSPAISKQSSVLRITCTTWSAMAWPFGRNEWDRRAKTKWSRNTCFFAVSDHVHGFRCYALHIQYPVTHAQPQKFPISSKFKLTILAIVQFLPPVGRRRGVHEEWYAISQQHRQLSNAIAVCCCWQVVSRSDCWQALITWPKLLSIRKK